MRRLDSRYLDDSVQISKEQKVRIVLRKKLKKMKTA
jgi:hypothetical protein